MVSFPPLIDMLKFSGYSYLIRGQPFKLVKTRIIDPYNACLKLVASKVQDSVIIFEICLIDKIQKQAKLDG